MSFAILAQAAGGGWVAARLAGSRPLVFAMIVGVLSLAGGVMAMSMFDSPAWMKVELPLYLVLAWGVGTLEVRRRESLQRSSTADAGPAA